MSERDARVARKFWREEQRHFIDEISGERGTIERRSGFEKGAHDFSAREFGDDSGQIDASAPCACANDFNSGILQLARFGRVEFRMSEDDEIVVGGFHDAAIRGNAEFGIENDSLKTPAAFESAAIGEKRVVGDDRADAGEQGVGRMAHAMNFGTRFFRRDPLTIRLSIFARFLERELAVERESGLQRDEWFLPPNVARESFVEALCWFFLHAADNFDSSSAKTLETTAFRRGIRILHRSNDPRDARGDDCFGAWTGAAGMIARLKRDVERRALRFSSSSFERHDFRVISILVLMKSLADDFAVAHNDAADRGVRARETHAFAREVERVVHEANVV